MIVRPSLAELVKYGHTRRHGGGTITRKKRRGRTATGGGGPANIVFHADWSTGLGSTTPLLLDSSKAIPFDNYAGPGGGGGLSVVAGNALPGGAPAPPDGIGNVLSVSKFNIDTAAMIQLGTTDGITLNNPHWPVLPIGSSFYYRVYTLMMIPNSEGNKNGSSNHPLQIPWSVSGFINFKHFDSMADGTQTFGTGPGQGGTPPPDDEYILGNFNGVTFLGEQIPKFVWYRWEFMWRRDTSSGYSFYTRLYNAANVLLYSEDGVGTTPAGKAVQNLTGGAQHNQKSMDGLFALTDTSYTRSLGLGTNGGAFDYTQTVFWYFAAVAAAQGPSASTSWIGRYANGI